MPEEKLYVGCKLIRAYSLSECDYLQAFKGEDVTGRENQPGYVVKYPYGYTSWSPKDVFENAYRLVTDSEKELI